jgi:hypothetical protein
MIVQSAMIQDFMKEIVKFGISFDAEGNMLEGMKDYRFKLPSNIPPGRYWSILFTISWMTQ